MADTLTDTGLEPAPSPELDYHALMVEEGYYEGGVLERYSPEFVKAAFKAAYAHRFRFGPSWAPSNMAGLKQDRCVVA